MVVALALGLTACGFPGATGQAPVPLPSPAAPSGEPQRESESSGPGRDEPRFLITCSFADGNAATTYAGLEEAWSSTNYVRIDSCDAAVARPDGFQLTGDERAVADVASADLPDADPTMAYLRTLAACVRLSPERLATEAASVLEATALRCPEAPQAGLIEQELSRRTAVGGASGSAVPSPQLVGEGVDHGRLHAGIASTEVRDLRIDGHASPRDAGGVRIPSALVTSP